MPNFVVCKMVYVAILTQQSMSQPCSAGEMSFWMEIVLAGQTHCQEGSADKFSVAAVSNVCTAKWLSCCPCVHTLSTTGLHGNSSAV